MQEQSLTELDAEKKTLEQSRAGAQSRVDSYRALYDENVSAEEKRTMDLYLFRNTEHLHWRAGYGRRRC